jgi:hypothetical protein
MGSRLAFEMLDPDRCWSVALKTYSEAVDSGFITKEGLPLKCDACFSTEFESVTIDTISGIVCEAEIICKNCKVSIAYCAYGSIQSKFLPY